MKYVLIRDVTPEECFWLHRTFKKGDVVYDYGGYTYGCISGKGEPFTEVENETPFFELPSDSVVYVDDGHIFPIEDDIYLK